MKLRERYFDDDGKLIVQHTQAVDPYLERAQQAREADANFVSDGWHVASLPAWLVYEEAKKRGIRPDDHGAMQEMLFSLINDSNYGAFRVKQGKV